MLTGISLLHGITRGFVSGAVKPLNKGQPWGHPFIEVSFIWSVLFQRFRCIMRCLVRRKLTFTEVFISRRTTMSHSQLSFHHHHHHHHHHHFIDAGTAWPMSASRRSATNWQRCTSQRLWGLTSPVPSVAHS